MKNKNFLQSFRHAVKGFCLALKNEIGFRFYFVNILITLPLNIIFDFSAMQFLIYIICIAGVFSAECANTAVEHLCDLITEEYNAKIKTVKDIAASAVFCWGIAFYISEIIMLGMNIIAW